MSGFSLQDRVVLITGASGGLGEALAYECAKRGARLAVCGRNVRGLKLVASKVKGHFYRLDVNQASSVKVMTKKIERDFGCIDVLINNAGMHMLSPVECIPETVLARVFSVNVFGPLRMIQAVLPGMKARGRGMVVQIGSTLAYRSLPDVGGYSASKAALMRMMESLRMELKPAGIKVLEVSPGVILTPLRKHAWYRGKAPLPSDKLPFARSAEVTAREIVDAMEAGRRDLMSASFPVRIFMKYLSIFVPGFLDARLRQEPSLEK